MAKGADEAHAFRARLLRIAGAIGSGAYALVIVWLYSQQPQTLAQVTGGVASAIGVYQIDRASFDEGLQLFRADRFAEARSAFARADRAERDPTVQFYVAYSFYREGWGRLYHDDGRYRQGLKVLNRGVSVAPTGRITIDDPDLDMHTSDELEAELERGLTVESSDFNPMRVFRRRR